MKRSRKSKKVSWAPAVNLVQVKLFQTEDCPSQVGRETQDRLEAKASWALHSNRMESNDLPPGFEGSHSVNQLKEELACIPRFKWKCPPKFVTSYNWQVAAGEESEEAEAQKLREMRVLEAVYPRLSAIPPSPAVSLDIEDEHYDDSLIPLVPMTSIEEELAQSDLAADIPADLRTPTNSQPPVNPPISLLPPVNPPTSLQPPVNPPTSMHLLVNPPISSQPPVLSQGMPASGTPNTSECKYPALETPASGKPALGMSTGVGADMITAASTALTAIVKSNEQGSMIDTDLLIKILGDPKMIEKLVNDMGAPPANTVSVPLSRLTPVTQSVPLATPKPYMVLSPRPTNGDLGQVPNGVRPALNSMPLQPVSGPLCGLRQVSPPLCGLKQVSPAVPLLRPDRAIIATPRLPNKNSYTVPNRLQPTFNIMPAQPNAVRVACLSTTKFQPAKDVNYYKNLIREHGGEKQETKDSMLSQYGDHNNIFKGLQLVQISKSREVKPKFQKVCMYFNSSKGCKNGSNCSFKHEMSLQKRAGHILEAQTAKRMKLGGEITGWI